MKRLALVLLLTGCASMQPPVSPEVTRLQAWTDSFESGWTVKTGWADPGYPVSMRSRQMAFYPTIYIRDEAAATRCGEVLIAALFARRFSGIPFSFAQTHVNKETVALLKARGWTDTDIAAAAKSCPSSIAAH